VIGGNSGPARSVSHPSISHGIWGHTKVFGAEKVLKRRFCEQGQAIAAAWYVVAVGLGFLLLVLAGRLGFGLGIATAFFLGGPRSGRGASFWARWT